MTVRDRQPPLQVVRAFVQPDGAALVHLQNVSGGVVGGDRLEMAADLNEGARAIITTTGATRVYRTHVDVDPALQTFRVTVGVNALLEYVPDPLIPFAGSRYRQETNITLESGAGLFWWETVAPGREAFGERFDYDQLELRLDITAGNRPIALERIRLEPARHTLSSIARLGNYGYFTTFYVCCVGLPLSCWQKVEMDMAETAAQRSVLGKKLWGVSALPAEGLVIRGVSCSGRTIAADLWCFWRQAKQALYGEVATLPRKVY